MPVVAFMVVWAGYGVMLHGWSALKGYRKEDGTRITLGDVFSPRQGGYSGPWGSTANPTASPASVPPGGAGTTGPNGAHVCPPGQQWDGKKCVKVITN